MAVSGIGPCAAPIDADGRSLMPAILYGIDSRAAKQMEELSAWCQQHDRPARFDSQSILPKILWIKENEPDTWEETKWIAGCGGYITYRLTGRKTVDAYESCNYMPARTVDSGRIWDKHLLDTLSPDIHDKLPHIVSSTGISGYLTRQAAEDTGLYEGLPVIAPTIDAAAEATSAGVTHPGDVMLMYGSTGFFIALQDHTPSADNPWRAEFLEPGQYSVAGGTNMLGTYVTWLMRILDISSYDELTELGEQSQPGAGGVLALPYLSGERTPLFNPDLTGLFTGMTPDTTRADMVRAGLEGLAYGIRNALDSMRIPDNARLHAVGGGVNNRLLVQTVSDVTGLAQLIPEQTVGASLGNAMRAAVGVGAFKNLSEAAGHLAEPAVVYPRQQFRELHERRFELFRQASKAALC